MQGFRNCLNDLYPNVSGKEKAALCKELDHEKNGKIKLYNILNLIYFYSSTPYKTEDTIKDIAQKLHSELNMSVKEYLTSLDFNPQGKCGDK